MSVLVYIECADNQIKGTSLEAISYAASCAKMFSLGNVVALVGGQVDLEALENLGGYGAQTVLHAADEKLAQPMVQPVATLIAEAAKKVEASLVVMAKSSLADGVVARLAIKLDASVAANVVQLPENNDGFVVKRSIFTGKAFADVKLEKATKILTIKKNTVPFSSDGSKASVTSFDVNFEANDFALTVKETHKATGDILLPEANFVVSGGRGLKGPENWQLILDLAKTIGAGTACSKPVSDMDWRPHHEHVGQTGIKISPNLYIAAGISGAIQHLAGVNSSKVIVVINKDPEAPFFKAADYGIVGDAFEVLPKLNEAFKKALA